MQATVGNGGTTGTKTTKRSKTMRSCMEVRIGQRVLSNIGRRSWLPVLSRKYLRFLTVYCKKLPAASTKVASIDARQTGKEEMDMLVEEGEAAGNANSSEDDGVGCSTDVAGE